MPKRHESALADRTALVTGAGSGIGRGIALALARRGARLALVGRRREALEGVAAEVAALGAEATVFPTDLTVSEQRLGLAERIHAAIGPLDWLVNNAGMLAGGPFANHSPSTIESALSINLTAPAVLVQQFLPDLVERKGTMVLVGSLMSFVPLPGATLYSASKSGLRAFGQALRYELQPSGVHVLMVHPAGTATAMIAPMARKAPVRAPLLDPQWVGEQTVRAALARRFEVQWGLGDRLLRLLYRAAPSLVQRVLAHQHATLMHLFDERDMS